MTDLPIFICYHCNDGFHEGCVGVSCHCGCLPSTDNGNNKKVDNSFDVERARTQILVYLGFAPSLLEEYRIEELDSILRRLIDATRVPDADVVVTTKGRSTKPMRLDQLLSRLEECRENCVRIASQREGTDRDGWLDDEAMYTEAIRRLRFSAAENLKSRLVGTAEGYRHAVEKQANDPIRRGGEILGHAMLYLNDQNPKNWDAVEILSTAWGKGLREYFAKPKAKEPKDFPIGECPNLWHEHWEDKDDTCPSCGESSAS